MMTCGNAVYAERGDADVELGGGGGEVGGDYEGDLHQ